MPESQELFTMLVMKYFWIIFLSIMFLIGIVYIVPPLRTQATKLLSYSICDTPLPYRIGSIDNRFGLTNNEVIADLQQASNVWSIAEGKTLFTYSPKASLTVNFIYDQRQALDTSINKLNSQLEQNNQTLNQQIADYKSDVAAYEQKLADFNATVKKYNNQGGAPKDVYDQLIKEQDQLNQEGQALNERARQLKLSTNDYNNNVSILNSDIAQFNNQLTQKPEQGLYDEANNTITVYFADNKEDLIHTLTHELGHALGMEHVSDKHAIMYAYTTPSATVTNADLQELAFACREQSRIFHDLHSLGLWLSIHVHQLQQSFAK